jgi:hypothetical protein
MAIRSVAASILLFASFSPLQAQDNQHKTNQGRIVKNIQATIVDVPVIGPIDARLDTPLVSHPIAVGQTSPMR